MISTGEEADHERPLSEINVTPLVDVMLVLLIIFIVAAPMFSQALRVDLPRVTAPTAADPSVLTLNVHADGRLELESLPIELDALPQRLRGYLARQPDAVLRLAADGAVDYAHVARVLAQVRAGGAERLALATQPPQ